MRSTLLGSDRKIIRLAISTTGMQTAYIPRQTPKSLKTPATMGPSRMPAYSADVLMPIKVERVPGGHTSPTIARTEGLKNP